MREVVIRVHCDVCRTGFDEQTEGSNTVTFTVYGNPRELDMCDECIGGSFLQEARPVTGKPDKPFGCHCGKRFDSQRGLSAHQTRQAHD
jgi:hypothetical protein